MSMKASHAIITMPFERFNCAIVTDGFVNYSGSLYNNNKGNFTVDEYIQYKNFDNGLQGKNKVEYKLITMQELIDISNGYEKKIYIDSKPIEITPDRYYEMLECLPPEKWNIHLGIESFMIIEAYTGNIHQHFFKFPKDSDGVIKYYSLFAYRSDKTGDLTEKLIKQIKSGEVDT